MNCNKCNEEAIENYANGKMFYFCRACRIEVMPPIDFSIPETDLDLEALNQEFIKAHEDMYKPKNVVWSTDGAIRPRKGYKQ